MTDDQTTSTTSVPPPIVPKIDAATAAIVREARALVNHPWPLTGKTGPLKDALAAYDKAGGPLLERSDLARLKECIDLRFNNALVEMEEGWDDSIVGFNAAWDIVREAFDGWNAALAAQPPKPSEKARAWAEVAVDLYEEAVMGAPPQPGDAEIMARAFFEAYGEANAKDATFIHAASLRAALDAAQSELAESRAENERLARALVKLQGDYNIATAPPNTMAARLRSPTATGEDREAARNAIARVISPQRWSNLNAGEESGELARAKSLLAEAIAAARAEGVREGVEKAAQISDTFTCGGCGMDGKAGAAIRALAAPETQGDRA